VGVALPRAVNRFQLVDVRVCRPQVDKLVLRGPLSDVNAPSTLENRADVMLTGTKRTRLLNADVDVPRGRPSRLTARKLTKEGMAEDMGRFSAGG